MTLGEEMGVLAERRRTMNFAWRHWAPVYEAIRGILFEPARTSLRGFPWEDCA